MFLWKLGVTLLCRQYVRNLWFVRRNFQQDLSFVSNIFTIIFERVTRIYPIDSCDTRCTRVTVANKHWRLKARVSQTHMCASLSARNEKRGTRKKTGGEKKTSNSTVTFDFWSALLFAGPEGKPLENFSSWESRSNIHRASGGSLFNPLFHFRDCCFK